MTHHDTIDRDLPAWLVDDAVRPMPDGLLDAIAADSRSRRQQPSWLVELRGDSMGAVPSGGARALRIALAVVLVALAALMAAIAAGMLPTQPGRSYPLAFIRDGDIYLAASDGMDAHLVLHQSGVEFQTVAWSPTGTRLALDTDTGVVFVLDIRSGHAAAVDGYNHSPAWSPDGDAIAVISSELNVDRPQTLRVLDAESLTTRATHPFAAIGGVVWSPNGRWIAATGGGDRSNAVLRIDVATGEVVQVGPASGHLDADKQVTWSPDSSAIAYIRYLEGDPATMSCYDSLACSVDVLVARADGSEMTRVNGVQGQANMPRWSPDGTLLAFRRADISAGDVGLGISLVRPDGTGEQPTAITAPVLAYIWRPAGDGFLFTRPESLDSVALWEASLTGAPTPLDPLIDRGGTAAGASLTFDLQASGP